LLEAEVKRTMIEQAGQPVLLLDDSKLAARGRQAIAPVNVTSLVLADGLGTGDMTRLGELGATVRALQT
jgi:DeoR/GlpR family transcriptional regulator of sugar metabolism